jgi:hypothetical protein
MVALRIAMGAGFAHSPRATQAVTAQSAAPGLIASRNANRSRSASASRPKSAGV